MTPKTKKILKWSIGIAGALGLGFTIYKLITRNTDGKDGKADDFEEPGNTTTNATSNVTSGSGMPSGVCGMIHTDYDGDFDYVRCTPPQSSLQTFVPLAPIWYTRSKPNGGRPDVYKTWVSLGGNATATQRLNTKYPNG